MTKSAQILALYAQGKSTREIADHVGTNIAYVRVVARQRKGGGESETDRRYRSSPLGIAKDRRAHAKCAHAKKAARQAIYYAMPEAERTAVARAARTAARQAGLSPAEANAAAVNAVQRAAYADPDRRAIARAAYAQTKGTSDVE